MGSSVFASIGGAAVFFMLIFLRALVREAKSRIRITKFRLTERLETTGAARLSIKNSSSHLDRAA